jgi:TPR repeat protein
MQKEEKDAEKLFQRAWDLYHGANGAKKDVVEAAKLFRKAAEKGHVNAMNALGECYREGEAVKRDVVEAVKWYRKAVEQGNAFAQCNLGVCYEQREGVKTDLVEAVRWYKKASEQGYADAQCNLGICYLSGEGVKKDLEEAARWFKKAADQGNAKAQEALEIFKQQGVKITTGMELTIPNPNESAKKELCGWCDGLLRKNLWCSGCKKVAYCGADCQLKAWPKHKAECKKK